MLLAKQIDSSDNPEPNFEVDVSAEKLVLRPP
jgi:hypothetical protein